MTTGFGKAQGKSTEGKGQKREVGIELDLHAMTVVEAMPLLHEYLNEAYLAGLKEVRIVHGKGTGTLRQAVMRELRKHPLARSFRPGGRGEGKSGATVVEL
jgi:DNA mismatch repair protein MutS2